MKINSDFLLGIPEAVKQNTSNISKLFVSQFNSSATNTISITPTNDCYIVVFGECDTWGYGGGTTTVSINCNSGSATVVKQMNGTTIGHDTTAVPVIAIGVFRGEANKAYTFTIGRSNSGGAKGQEMFLFTIPR